MTQAVLLYLLCLASGLTLDRHLSLSSLLQRFILVFTLAGGQLVISVQCLSLIHKLEGTWLLLFNALITALVVWLGRRTRIPDSRPWLKTLTRTWAGVAAQARSDLWTNAVLVVALGILAIYSLIAWALIPMPDSYHFEMPLYWIQNRSIMPFPVNNPRIVTVSFVSEALALPGYLYLHTSASVPALALFAFSLIIGIIFALARRLGCGFGAAVCASAITLGFTSTAQLLIRSQTEVLLTGMWSGASLLLLLDSRSVREAGEPWRSRLWGSVLCFLMACGAKNSTILVSPLYLIILVMVHGRWLLKLRSLAILAGGGVMGLLCSGVAWNYVHNRLWTGDVRGNELMKATLSQDFRPRAVWTRLCRGTVLTVFDTVWVPKAAEGAYVTVCQSVLSGLGAGQRQDEDDEFYGLNEKTTMWRKGLGLLGIVFFVPGIAAGLWRCFARSRLAAMPNDSARFANLILVVMGLGSFVICHVVLRWQSIGLLRLMPLFTVAGAALCAPLLGSRWARITALGLLVTSAAVFSTQGLGQAARRFDWSGPGGVLKRIRLLQRSRPVLMDYQWDNEPARQFAARDWFHTKREVYQVLLQGVRQPAVIGFVGGMNSESYYLFGDTFQNKVVSLVDFRKPESWLEPSNNLDYVVCDVCEPETAQWVLRHGFRLMFWAKQENACVLSAFQRIRP